MKKTLLTILAVAFALIANAQTVYDFSDATKWGSTNPNNGEFTQIESGGTITNGNLKISCTYPEGKSGLRFFANTNTGAVNFRGYVGTEMTISTVDGSKMTGFEFNGSNYSSTYVTGEGFDNGVWKGNASSVTLSIIKSTLQINSITVYADGEAPVDISNTPETAYTVSKAHELIAAGQGLTASVYVKGTIKSITEIELEQYFNATYVITDGTKDLVVYHGNGLGGSKFKTADDIQDGDEVIVYGKIKDYNGTYEFDSYSEIYSLNGKTKADIEPENPDTPGDYTLVGAGTLDNPYTVADITNVIYKEDTKTEGVWVKGVIVGCFGSASEPIASKTTNSNICLANAEKNAYIPVQLVYVKDGDNHIREQVNIVDNPDNVGKEVYVFGNIEKYFSVAGMKSTSDYSWDGNSSAIKAVGTDSTAKTIYTLSGAKVNVATKGIFIKDGKKVLVK